MSATSPRRPPDLQTLNQRASREERREQLIKVAAHIVEFEGIDALKHVRIAELAGCGRPLVYSYFPKKSDLYFAISESFYLRLEASFTCDEQYQAIRDFLAGDSSRTTQLESLIWDVVDEYGCAGLILRSVPELNEDFQSYHRELVNRYEFRWQRYFLELGADALAARLLLDNCTAITKNFALAYRRGEMDRETSLKRTLAALGALVQSEMQAIQKRKDKRLQTRSRV